MATSSIPRLRRRRVLWRAALRQPSVWRRACTLGLSAGFLQAAINQGDLWLGHRINVSVVIKTIVSPMIGFTLVLISAAETWIQRTLEQDENTGHRERFETKS